MRSARTGVALAALGMLVLAGCSEEPRMGASTDAIGEVATEWVELLCQGQYTAADDALPEGFRLQDSMTEGDAAQLLAEIDAEAADRLAALEAEGVDTTPVVEVDGFGREDPLQQEVHLSGTCFGQEFSVEDVTVQALTSPPVVTERIPTFEVRNELFTDAQWPGWSPAAVETGTFLPSDDSSDGAWVLPPGEHTITIPDHFLMAGPYEGTVTTDLFGVVTPAPVPETDPTIGAEAVAAFWEQCGEICAVPVHPSRGTDTITSPVVPVPVESDGETVTVEGVEGEIAIAIPPADPIESWNSVTPRGWPEQDGYEGGQLSSDPAGSLLTVECATGESCSVPLGTITAPENGVDSYYMAEVDGTVQITHLYATGG